MQFSTIYIYIYTLRDFISDSCIEPGTRNATITFVRFRNNIISRERPKFSRKWLLDWRINRAMEFLEINYFAVGEAAWNETRLYTCDRVPAHVFRERRVILISEPNNRDRDSRGGGTRGMKISWIRCLFRKNWTRVWRDFTTPARNTWPFHRFPWKLSRRRAS